MRITFLGEANYGCCVRIIYYMAVFRPHLFHTLSNNLTNRVIRRGYTPEIINQIEYVGFSNILQHF